MNHFPPVNPQASPEARQLLQALQRVYGQKTLSGQHNFIGRLSIYSDRVAEISGRVPALWGSDWGFSGTPGDIDWIGKRDELLAETIRQHEAGSLICISYHQGNPRVGEPCDFKTGVQSRLTPQEWIELLTTGTPLHTAWKAQMDCLAVYLAALRERRIPVLFRPYHEMNGGWFWWGAHPGDQGYTGLWRMLFDYYTKERGLDNLIWVWCSDVPDATIGSFYPGHDCVDILGCDIYPKGRPVIYPDAFWEIIQEVAEGRPVALTENSAVPDSAVLSRQPWLWFMSWTDLVEKDNSPAAIRECFLSERVWNRDDWAQA